MKIPKLFTLIVFLFYCTTLLGQKNTFLELKKTYHTKDFKFLKEKPIYSQKKAALRSLLIPGLGQYYLDEPKLGAKDMVGGLVVDGVAVLAMTAVISNYFHEDPYTTTPTMTDRDMLALVAWMYLTSWPGISAALRLFSVINALQIAQIKSVAYEDKKSNSLSLILHPEIKYHSFNSNTGSMVCGLNMTITF